MNHFYFTVFLIAALIVVLLVYIGVYAAMDAMRQDDNDYQTARSRIKRKRRSLWLRLGDFWYYWWHGGMSFWNAVERAGRVF